MTTKADVITALRELRQFLELDGANQFKSGAFEKAARALESAEIDLAAAIAGESLTDIPGIGKSIAGKIADIWNTGTTGELEELRSRIPHELLDLAAIGGLGPKKVRALYDQLGITELGELEAKCRSGEVAALKGFGEKTAANILKAVELRKSSTGLFRADVARHAALELAAALVRQPGVLQHSICGSVRRRKEVSKDIDLLVATRDAAPLMEFFTTLPQVRQVLGHGETKSSIILANGMQADLRCVSPEQYPFALNYFTGSKEHNTALRARAKKSGLKLNEYGLYPEGAEVSLPAREEADIYAHLRLQYVEPELREDMGEIEAAEKHALPALVTRADIRGLAHMHTHYSDGTPQVEDYAKWAAANRIEWMGIADHSQSAAYAGGLKPDRVRAQQAEIDEVNARWVPKGVRLLKGIESDILGDGSLDYTEDVLATFDFVVASVHSRFNLSEADQTARMIRAIENPFTTILGHPTGRLLLERDAYSVDQRALIGACAKHGVAVEINAHPMRLDLDWRLVHFALEEGCFLSIGPDAHDIRGLDVLDFGLGIARKGWATRERVVNCMGVEEFLGFAGKMRGKPRA